MTRFDNKAKLTDFLDFLAPDRSRLNLLKPGELSLLAQCLRTRILDAVSKTGGHLASSLGTVELTTALYHVFNLEEDIVLWDVGHQAYAHKLLTGRNRIFEKIGTKGNISKFLRREESSYDHFGAGHASTAISASLGFLIASEQARQNRAVIAVVGDGAMTGGLAYEAINFAGHLKKNLLVVLNDNSMSIDKNIGLLTKTFNLIKTNDLYNQIRELLTRLEKDKSSSSSLVSGIRRIDHALMEFLSPKAWFEALGFRYFGPVDGHNLQATVDILKTVKSLQGPILVHLRTVKGKGYRFAEEDSCGYHGVTPFVPQSGKMLKKSATGVAFTKLWSETFSHIFHHDRRVLAISAAMLNSVGLKKLHQAEPERVFDVGIAEASGVCMAAGMAAAGYKPFVAIYSTFLQRAYDQLIHDVGLQNLPVRFILDRAGFVGADGATHNGVFDFSYLRPIPNFVIMSPRNGKELSRMLYTAYNYQQGPIAIRYPRGNSEEFFTAQSLPLLDDAEFNLEIGRGEIIRHGSDGAILAIGEGCALALKAAAILADKGLNLTVFDARFLKPLDQKSITQLARDHDWLVTVEENSKIGGFGSAVLEYLNDKSLARPLLRFGVPDRFIDHGTIDEQRTESGMTADQLATKVLNYHQQLLVNS